MAAKDCGHHCDDVDRKLPYRHLLSTVVGFLILAVFLVFLTWLILRPSKPHFILQNVTVFALNLTSTNAFTTNLQITIASRNSNARIAINYEEIAAYAAYRGQRVTLPARLPATYQGHKETIVWSPFLYGNKIPVPPHLAASLNQDQIAGTVMVSVRFGGRIRWKVGTLVTAKYRLSVNCPVYVNVGGRNGNGIAVGTATFQNQLIMDCHVDA